MGFIVCSKCVENITQFITCYLKMFRVKIDFSYFNVRKSRVLRYVRGCFEIYYFYKGKHSINTGCCDDKGILMCQAYKLISTMNYISNETLNKKHRFTRNLQSLLG